MKTKCIKEEVLMDYLEGHLSEKKRGKVEHHLADCDACLEALTITGKMQQEDDLSNLEPVPEHVTKQAIASLKALKKESLTNKVSGYLGQLTGKCSEVLTEAFSLRQPALMLVRGGKATIGDDLVVLKKSFPDFDAEIEIEKRDEDRVFIKVKTTKGGNPVKSIRITLFDKGREVSSYLDPLAFFEDIPFGHYILRFTRFTKNGGKTREYPFEIRGNGNKK